MTSGRINMITLDNIKLSLDGRLSFAFEPFSSAKSSYAAVPVRMSVYKQAPYYYYYY